MCVCLCVYQWNNLKPVLVFTFFKRYFKLKKYFIILIKFIWYIHTFVATITLHSIDR